MSDSNRELVRRYYERVVSEHRLDELALFIHPDYVDHIRRSADLLLDGWTVDDEGPLSPPEHCYSSASRRSVTRVDRLTRIERGLSGSERAAHSTARLSLSKRLTVYVNAIEAPTSAAGAALAALARRTSRAIGRDLELVAVVGEDLLHGLGGPRPVLRQHPADRSRSCPRRSSSSPA